MAESEDHEIRCTAFGWPARDAAYLSITTMKGQTFRFHFGSKSVVKLFRSQAQTTEDKWPD